MKVQGNKGQSEVSRMDGKKRIRGVKFWTSRLIFKHPPILCLMFMFKVSDHSDFENIGCFVFPGQLFLLCFVCVSI